MRPRTSDLRDALDVTGAVLALAGPLALRPDRLPQVRAAARSGTPIADVLGILHGHRIAVVDDERSWTYEDLAEQTRRFAHALNTWAEARPDCSRTIAVLCRNSGWIPVVLDGATGAGFTAVLLSTDMGAQQIRDVVVSEGISLVVHDADLGSRLNSVPDSVELLVAAGAKHGSADLASWLSTAPSTLPPRPKKAGRTVMLTSGSSGTPKRVGRSNKQSALVPLGSLQKIPVRKHDRVMVAAPAFHGWGMLQLRVAHLVGATVLLRARFDARATVELLETQRCTVLVAVPTMLQRILDLGPTVLDEHPLPRLRIIASGGARLAPSLVTAIHARFGNRLHNLYGSTETSFITIATPRDLRDAPSTAGRPPVGNRLVLRDPEGRPVAVGTEGEVFAATPSMITQYDDGTPRRIVDRTVGLGDLGRLDDRGRLFIEGRIDRMVVSGGENVYPEEVEALLVGHPAIADTAVLAVPDLDFGQRLHAFIVLEESAKAPSEAELSRLVAEHLSRAKVPRAFTVVPDIPRGAMGKVSAAALSTLTEPEPADQEAHA